MNSTYSHSQSVGVRAERTDCRLPNQIQRCRILNEYVSKCSFRISPNQINEIWTFWRRSMVIARNLLLFVIEKWEEIGPTPPDRLCSRLLLGGHCYLDVLTGLHSLTLSCHCPDCVALTKQMRLRCSYFFFFPWTMPSTLSWLNQASQIKSQLSFKQQLWTGTCSSPFSHELEFVLNSARPASLFWCCWAECCL